MSREWGRDGIQVTLNVTWLLALDGLHKWLLSYWDFHTLTIFRVHTERSSNEKITSESVELCVYVCVGSLVPVRGQTIWETIERQQ